MIVPNTLDFDDYNSFFKEFSSLNKSKYSFFSYDYFAAKINWPKSLLPDLIAGRKNLSIRRILEFSDYFKMTLMETENLIMWSVLGFADKDYFSSHLQRIFFESFTPTSKEDIPVDIGRDTSLLAVLAVLEKSEYLPSPAEIIRMLPIAYGLSELKVEAAIKKLLEVNRLVLGEDDRILTVNCNLHLDENPSESEESSDKASTPEKGSLVPHQVFAHNLLNFCKDPVPGTSGLNSFYVNLNEQSAKKLKKKLNEMYYFIEDLEKNSRDSNDDRSLYQIDVNLFPFESKKL